MLGNGGEDGGKLWMGLSWYEGRWKGPKRRWREGESGGREGERVKGEGGRATGGKGWKGGKWREI